MHFKQPGARFKRKWTNISNPYSHKCGCDALTKVFKEQKKKKSHTIKSQLSPVVMIAAGLAQQLLVVLMPAIRKHRRVWFPSCISHTCWAALMRLLHSCPVCCLMKLWLSGYTPQVTRRTSPDLLSWTRSASQTPYWLSSCGDEATQGW